MWLVVVGIGVAMFGLINDLLENASFIHDQL